MPGVAYILPMAEIRTVTTLSLKRAQLESAIIGYERALSQARVDLAHVNACIAMFDHEPTETPRFADLNRLFRRHELSKLCLAALSAESPLDTREVATRVMIAKGFDPADDVLKKKLTYRVVNVLRSLLLKGKVADHGRKAGVRVWRGKDL